MKVGFDVFLSYWPANSKVAAGLKDQLAEIFGDDHVRNTAYDEDVSWPLTQVERVFPASAVMVVLIGRDWADLTDQRGSRLDEPANSHLRNELLQAFRLNLLVVPVCIDGAAMPDRDQLPAFLRPLAGFRPTRLRTADLDTDKRLFRRDARALAREIEAEWRRRQGLFPQWVIGLACAVAIIAAVAAGAWGSVLLDILGLPLPPAGRLRTVEDNQALWQRLGAAEKERDESRGEAAAMRDQLARLLQQLAAAERERDDARRKVVTLYERRDQLAAAGKERDEAGQESGQSAAAQRERLAERREIALTIDNVPSQYDEKVVLRLVLSALRGGMLTDVVGIRQEPATAGRTRVVVLTVNSAAVDLAVAGQRVDCHALSCTLKVALRPWYVDSRAGDRDEPRFIAGTRLRGGERVDAFFGRFGAKDVSVPKIMQSGQTLVYLPDDSYFQIYLRGAFGEKAPFVDIRGGDYNLLRLERAGQRWSIRPDYDPSLPVVADR